MGLFIVGFAFGLAARSMAQGGGPGRTLPLPTTLEDFKQPGSQTISIPTVGEVPIVDPILPPRTCLSCHGEVGEFPSQFPAPGSVGATIMNAWQGSMMAHASRDPLFEACLAIAEQDAPGSGDLCLRCHVPTAWLAGRSTPTDGSAVLDSDRLGVNCNFCHRMVNPLFVDGESPEEDLPILSFLAQRGLQPKHYGNGMYVIDPNGRDPSGADGVLRGARVDVMPAHDVIISPFHRESAFCGTCHDVSNPAYEFDPRSGRFVPNAFNQRADDFSPGHLMPIERTYSEWVYSAFNSPAGVDIPNRGRVSTCQDCHMRKGPGRLALSQGLRDDAAVHDLTGGNTWVPRLIPRIQTSEAVINAGIERARATLRSAAALSAEQVGDSVRVRVTNNTGHKLPTGYPEGRRMWLEIRFLDPNGRFIQGSGLYNGATGELIHDDEIKVYETELGVGPAVSALTGIPAKKSFHFVVNNRVIKDNRIPPRGFRNDTFARFHGAPVDYHYDDGQYWDDTFYQVPPGARTVVASLMYQTASKEYVEFLRDENHTNNAGQHLFDLWQNNKSVPQTMAGIPLLVVSQDHIFVDAQATGRNDGTTWFDAFLDLQEALDYAAVNAGVKEIRIAQGTYRPDRGTEDRSATFSVRGGLALRGGFPHLSPREPLPPAREELQPDPAAFPTILTGDLQGDDLFGRGDTADNSRHVVTITGGGIVDAPVRLTGLTILAGNADDRRPAGRELVPLGEGAGLLVDGGEVIVTDCTLERNAANLRGGAIAVLNQGSLVLNHCSIERNRAPRGGGVYIQGGNPNLVVCTFKGNVAFADLGGAVYCEDADGPQVVSCVFTENHARGLGGAVAIGRGPNAGMFRGSSTPAVINCTLTRNTSDGSVAGAYFDGGFSRPIVSNCILWDNRASLGTAPDSQILAADTELSIRYSCVQDGDPDDSLIVPGLRNIDDDPQFINPSSDNLRLSLMSPCINAGDNSRLPADVADVDGDGNTREPLPLDLDGNRRVANQTVDMGAYELTVTLPRLIRIMDGLGPAPDTFISPLGEDCPLTSFRLEANEPLTLNGMNATYTGAGPVPTGALVDLGGGLHTVSLDPSPEPGQWLKLDLDVTGAGNGSATLTVWVAHQPLDIDQDRRTTISDATTFGGAFSDQAAHALIDVNCDGIIDIRDATAFGLNWNAGWSNTSLPPKP